MMIEQFSSDHPRWAAYRAHLDRVRMARWAVTAGGQPLAQTYYLGVMVEQEVVGHLSLLRQPLTLPAAGDQPPAPVSRPDGTPLDELFVQTFAVDTGHRRRGYGRALQQAALQLARDLGVYQLRSWSSYDHPENYALKLRLGFAACPAVFETDTGLKVSGIYFVKTV